MPIYEYRCGSCSQTSEHLQKMSDPAPDACPHCGNGPLSKLMSQTSFILKGGGWYVTDFRDKKTAKGTGGQASGNQAAGNGDAAPTSGASGSESGAAEKTSPPSNPGPAKSGD